MRYDISKLIEKTTMIRIGTMKRIVDLETTFLFNYEIFPRNIMTFFPEWAHEKRTMSLSDTIVQQVYLPPHPQFSAKLILGVRINEIINEPNRLGFSYETISGHIERGVSTFTIEQTTEGEILFSIHTFSKPATLLTQFVRPIISIPYQSFVTKKALENVKRQLEK